MSQREMSQSAGEKEPMELPEDEWRRRLDPARYEVLRRKGTEPAWSGELLHVEESGMFRCAGCGTDLFSSKDKFDSGSGWPSFDKAVREGNVVEHPDHSFGMVRTEVTCGRCGGHLGHLFPDGPTDTGMRYCINSLALDFEPGAESPGDAPGDHPQDTKG